MTIVGEDTNICVCIINSDISLDLFDYQQVMNYNYF